MAFKAFATRPEDYLDMAVSALADRADAHSLLDELPVPVYTTDAFGNVTYWNHACVDFAGREPQLGKDKWCVTWRIHRTSGEHLPHDQCPMAEAIRRRQPIRGEVAIAMRPDGSRRAFAPYPTPLFDQAGEMTGAVNLLIDVTNEQASALAAQASRCRRLACSTSDRPALDVLAAMADELDAAAMALRG